MKHSSTRARMAWSIAVSIPLVVAACAEPSAQPDAPTAVAASQPSTVKDVGDELAQLRQATVKFHDFDFATSPTGGNYEALTPCMVDPALGGMGFHFAKKSAIDGTINPNEPEVLLYEPEQNGKMRLVAVEYIIPYEILPRSSTPPTVFGQDLLHNDIFGVWARHAWVWKNNPSGIFFDWNPTVNCDAVAASARMTHSH